MNRLSQLALIGVVLTMSASPCAFAVTQKKIAITELTQLQAQPLSELIKKSGVAVSATAKPLRLAAAVDVVATVPLKALLAAPAQSLSSLLKGKVTAAAPMAAVAPTPAPEARRTSAVVVSIPVEPGAEPVAVPAESVSGRTIVRLASAASAKVDAIAAAVAAPTTLTVTVKKSADGLALEPASLRLSAVGQTANIVVAPEAEAGLSMFVRDAQTVTLNAAKRELHALQKGVTELYVVGGGKMYILPVTVEAGQPGSHWDLQIPAALVSLDGVMSTAGASALYIAPEAPTLKTPTDLVDATVVSSAPARATDDAITNTSAERPDYKPLRLQVVDDRSTAAGDKLYPVGQLEVSLVGTEFRGFTDSTGHITIPDMPSGSRFLVQLNDQTGAVRAGVAEIDTFHADTERIMVMRQLSFDTYSQVVGSSQDSGLGSLCATFVDGEFQPRDGLGLSFDLEGLEGPYFFNRFGFLDMSLRVTGPDGRFCAFNVPAGPVAVTVYEEGAPLATLPLTVHAGRHSEDTLVLADEAQLTTRLATLPTAHEQLNADSRVALGMRSVDMIDLIPLGTDSPMMQMQAGLVASVDPLYPVHGRFFAYAQAAEFEPVVYAYEQGRRSVTPLLPRGFIEDMSVYAQVSYDPMLGSVVAEYKVHSGINDDEHVLLRLLDANNQAAGDAWIFADRPTTKAVFFNVPAGTYALVAETGDGFWLGADTVTVYNETVSYARLGTPWK